MLPHDEQRERYQIPGTIDRLYELRSCNDYCKPQSVHDWHDKVVVLHDYITVLSGHPLLESAFVCTFWSSGAGCGATAAAAARRTRAASARRHTWVREGPRGGEA